MSRLAEIIEEGAIPGTLVFGLAPPGDGIHGYPKPRREISPSYEARLARTFTSGIPTNVEERDLSRTPQGIRGGREAKPFSAGFDWPTMGVAFHGCCNLRASHIPSTFVGRPTDISQCQQGRWCPIHGPKLLEHGRNWWFDSTHCGKGDGPCLTGS